MTHTVHITSLFLGLKRKGLNDQNDNSTIINAFFADFAGRFPIMAERLQAIRGVTPTSSTLEREFSALTIILNPLRNRLYCPTLLQILQGRNFRDLSQMTDSDKAKINV